MRKRLGPNVSVVFKGNTACFSESGLDLNRSTYAFPPPSAICGMLSAIYWKPQMVWFVDSVEILNPIEHTFYRTKEFKNKMGTKNEQILRGNRVLVDVEYRVHAYPVSLDDENPIKHSEIFNRRVQKGDMFKQPFLGSTDHLATVHVSSDKEPINLTINTGRMLFGFPEPDARDTELKGPPDTSRPIYFNSSIENGVVCFPEEKFKKMYPHAFLKK